MKQGSVCAEFRHPSFFCFFLFPKVLSGTPYNPLVSEIWSLGVMLYVMVCGIMPFDDSDHVAMVRAQREKNWKFNPDRKASVIRLTMFD